ncbi:Uncharacterised protein [Dermacoccus nishinomiyaensis]|nr:Uncharacterised protein [Dermacoccus nishinomiyaensis]
MIGGFKRAWDTLKTVLSAPLGWARDEIHQRWKNIKTNFTTVKDWVFGAFKRAWDGLKKLITSPVDGAKTALNNILGKDDNGGIRGMFNSAVKAVGKIWTSSRAS